MSLQSPFKLEINIISANELPPVSKMLRTFAVAYMHPDQKLSTKIDHQGHTNPTWNYKEAFHVDENFLKNESSAITFEIYNLAWLRDLPIGTARLSVNTLAPPLNKNPAFRRVALRLCRPSGHLQGTLNLGVQLVDNAIGDDRMSLFTMKNVEQTEDEEEDHDKYIRQEEENIDPGDLSIPQIENVGATPESRCTDMPESEHETKAVSTSSGSTFSVMKSLPTDVAEDMKKGPYATGWNDYGSSIFENWTEKGGNKSDLNLGMKQEKGQWPTEDLIPLTADKKNDRKRRPEKKKGLLSCFGNAYGFQFSIICGLQKKK